MKMIFGNLPCFYLATFFHNEIFYLTIQRVFKQHCWGPGLFVKLGNLAPKFRGGELKNGPWILKRVHPWNPLDIWIIHNYTSLVFRRGFLIIFFWDTACPAIWFLWDHEPMGCDFQENICMHSTAKVWLQNSIEVWRKPIKNHAFYPNAQIHDEICLSAILAM